MRIQKPREVVAFSLFFMCFACEGEKNSRELQSYELPCGFWEVSLSPLVQS